MSQLTVSKRKGEENNEKGFRKGGTVTGNCLYDL